MRMNNEKWFKGDINYNNIKELIDQRLDAKAQKNWQLADQIRDDLLNKGIIIEDKQNKTEWKYK